MTNEELLKDKIFNNEYVRCMTDTLYWYNTYVRKETEPVLTQEEWDAKKSDWEQERINSFKDKFNFTKNPVTGHEFLFRKIDV